MLSGGLDPIFILTFVRQFVLVFVFWEQEQVYQYGVIALMHTGGVLPSSDSSLSWNQGALSGVVR